MSHSREETATSASVAVFSWPTGEGTDSDSETEMFVAPAHVVVTAADADAFERLFFNSRLKGTRMNIVSRLMKFNTRHALLPPANKSLMTDIG